jgi:hypothetical protein
METLGSALLFGKIYLETDDVTILYLALSEGKFWLHDLNHSWLNFLHVQPIRSKSLEGSR